MTARSAPSATELVQLGVIAASMGLGSLLPGPSTLDSTARPWPVAVVVAMLGLALVAAQRRWPHALSGRRGGAALLGGLMAAVAGIAAYLYCVETWTCPYYAEVRITGAQLTTFAQRYVEQEPNLGCEELLKRFTGRSDEIWTRASSVPRELLLSALHLSVLAALTLSALHTVRLLAGSRQRRLVGARSRQHTSATRSRHVQPIAGSIDELEAERHAALAGREEHLTPLAVALSHVVLAHETILRHAQSALRAPELIEIPSPAHARSLWVAVLRRAEQEAAVQELVALVLDENPAADALRAALRAWQHASERTKPQGPALTKHAAPSARERDPA